MWLRGKRFLPKSLLGRSLLLILVPLVIVQAVALEIFYGTHLNLVSRRFSAAVAGEIAQTIDLLHRYPGSPDRRWIMREAQEKYSLNMKLIPDARAPTHLRHRNIIGPMDDDLAIALREQVGRPFVMDWRSNEQFVILQIDINEDVLVVEVPRKRLYAETMYFFVAWIVGSALLLFFIAALFMRNQVRAMRRLALAVEAFGIGRTPGALRPEGAAEVRRAATAFNRMQERISRFLTQRTEMLAGVSHDLRTPLTRLRLALAMLPADSAQEAAEMTADVDEMDRMIGGYLAFARGEGLEQAQSVNLTKMLEEIVDASRRAGRNVELDSSPDLDLMLRPVAIKRAVTNLVDNALRHGERVLITARAQERNIWVTIDDNGPGIPPDRRESVFRPYETNAVGGTGLGLTIARDTARAHGGDVTLDASPLGGLQARVRFPS